MKTSKHFIAALVMIAMTTVASFAQVKIGSNPTTIDPASNLEVEGSNGKKVIVSKTGTVKIENVPAGALTDSLLVVDAQGNVKLKSIGSTKSVTQVNPYIRLKGNLSAPTNSPTTYIYLTNSASTLINQMTHTAATGVITIQKSGLYFFTINSYGATNLSDGAKNDQCGHLFKNGVVYQSACARSSAFAAGATNTGIISLAAGDQVRIALTTASDQAINGTYEFITSIYKVSELP